MALQEEDCIGFDGLVSTLSSRWAAKSRQVLAESHALQAWAQAAKDAKAHQLPIPMLNYFGVKTSFEENLLEALSRE